MSIFSRLGDFLTKENSYQDTIDLLMLFYDVINSNTITFASNPNIQEIFELIFRFLIKCSSSESENIRMMSYRAAGFMLVRCYPFFPLIIPQAYAKICLGPSYDPKSSFLIISMFSFIVDNHPLQSLYKFLENQDIYLHFCTFHSSTIDGYPKIVSQMKKPGVEWNRILLKKYLLMVEENYCIPLYRCISNIVNLFPNELFSEFISNSESPELISFVLSSIPNSVDIYQACLYAFNKLKTDMTPSDFDSSMYILSRSKDAVFNLIDQNICVSLTNQHLTIPLEKFGDRPSICYIPIDYDIISIKENDGYSLISGKYAAMTRLMLDDERAFQVIQNIVLSDSYEKISLCTRGIANNIGFLLDHKDSIDICFMIQNLCFVKIRNWSHGLDIVNLVSSIPKNRLKFVFGKGLYSLNLKIMDLIKFNNDQLYSRVISSLIHITENDFVLSFIMDSLGRFDLFSPPEMIRVNRIILSLIEHYKYDMVFHKTLLYILIESLDFHRKDIVSFSLICEILSHFDLSEVPKSLIKGHFQRCVCIISCIYRDISGILWDVYSQPKYLLKIQNTVNSYIKDQIVDITLGSSLNLPSIYNPLFGCLSFVLSFSANDFGKNFILALIEKMSPLNPLNSLLFVKKNKSLINHPDLYFLITTISRSIVFSSNTTAISQMFLFFYQESQSGKSIISDTIVNSFYSSMNGIEKTVDLFDDNDLLTFLNANCPDFQNSPPYWLPKRRLESVLSIKSAKNPSSTIQIKSSLLMINNRYIFDINQEDPSLISQILVSDIFDNDYHHLGKLLDYCRTNHLPLIIPKIIPLSVFHMIYKHVYSFNPKDGSELCRKYISLINDYNNIQNISLCNPEILFEMISKENRPKKKHLLLYLSVFNLIKHDFVLIEKLSKQFFETSQTTNQKVLSVIFASMYLNSSAIISPDYGVTCSDFIRKNIGIDMSLYFYRLSYYVSLRCGILPLSRVSTNHQEMSCILQTYMTQTKRDTPSSLDICCDYLKSSTPSVYLAGLRILYCAITSLLPQYQKQYIKSCFSILISSFPQFHKIPFSSELVFLISNFLLQDDNSHELKNMVLKKIDTFFPNNDKASCEPILAILPVLYTAVIPVSRIYEKLNKKVETFLFSPPNEFLFHVYILSLETKTRSIESKSQKETMVSDPMIQWLSLLSDYDSYWIDDAILEWVILLNSILGLEQCFALLTIQFSKHTPRFHTLLIAMAKFIKKYGLKMNNDDIKSIKDTLISANMCIDDKLHLECFSLLTNFDNLKDALDLAVKSAK